ncbi:MAG: hypothetical protein K6C12_13115 [Oscillospiraceae bacterium]|nr:hypothetical protein [Oscillospiraceae bacterium]
MAIARADILDVLKDSYGAYYSIVENVNTELPLGFRADYAARDERYWLTKSVKIWGNEKNEFCYVFAAEAFSPELAEACMEWALQDGLPRVKPHPEHQCTNIKVVLVADSVDEATAKAVQKKHFTKNYKFGLHGYSNLLAGIVDLGTEKTVTNREGHELVPYFKKLFAARA